MAWLTAALPIAASPVSAAFVASLVSNALRAQSAIGREPGLKFRLPYSQRRHDRNARPFTPALKFLPRCALESAS
jgi:hypothetical protein